MFKIVDGRTDDGHRSDWYTISSHMSLRLRWAKNKCSVKMLPQMVLSTENNYYTNIISRVMMLVAPISGLTVKISRFSLDPPIAYIHQHLFKICYFQFEHCYDTLQNIHIPYPCIRLFSLFVQPKYTAVGSFSWHYFPSSFLLCIILFSVSILI